MTFGNAIFPFNNCNDNDIVTINNSDILTHTPNEIVCELPNYKISEQAFRASNLNSIDFDCDVNISNLSSCEYYTCLDLSNLNNKNKNLNNFNIFHNNLNGLESKFEHLRNLLSSNSFDFDIIALTETSEQFNSKFKTNVDLEGYSLSSSPTTSEKGGSALYIKNKFNAFERHDLNIINDHFESTWVEIKNQNIRNVVIASIYRHPHDNLEIYNTFLIYMEKILLQLSKEKKEIYICGDFNSDLLKIDSLNNYSRFYELLASFGLVPFILLPTRITGNSATIIDNIFTNNTSNAIISGNIITDLSDHFSQFISVQKLKFDLKTTTFYRRDYTNFSEQSFRDDVSIQNFNNQNNDVNKQFADFFFKLEGCVNRHAPLKKLTSKESKLSQKPWISSNILKMITIKNKLFNRKKRQPNNDNIKILYNIFRNRVNRELNKSKKEYYSQYFEDNKTNSKKTWEGIRAIININKSKFKCITQLNVNDKIIDNPKEIVESLNDFFVNVGPNTEKNIPRNPVGKPENYLLNKNQTEFVIANIDKDEVMKIINELESKSTGPHSIPVNLLKLAADLIIEPLCEIITNSFSSGIFPDALKICKVVPIHKGESTQELNNYRPISLLSIFDKIIEKLMHKQLYNFLNAHDILFNNQFGFRKNNSTSFALIQITEKIKESIEKKKIWLWYIHRPS